MKIYNPGNKEALQNTLKKIFTLEGNILIRDNLFPCFAAPATNIFLFIISPAKQG